MLFCKGYPCPRECWFILNVMLSILSILGGVPPFGFFLFVDCCYHWIFHCYYCCYDYCNYSYDYYYINNNHHYFNPSFSQSHTHQTKHVQNTKKLTNNTPTQHQISNLTTSNHSPTIFHRI